jgi:hypothetical protein
MEDEDCDVSLGGAQGLFDGRGRAMPEDDKGPTRAPEPYWTSGRVTFGMRMESSYTVEDENGNVIEQGTQPPEGTVGGTAVTVTGGG